MYLTDLNGSPIPDTYYIILYPMQQSCGSILESGCPSVCKCRHGFRALERYPFHLELPKHMTGEQRSSAMDIEVEIRSLSSRTLSFPLTHHITHITLGRKMFPIDFGVQRSSVQDIEVEMWFPNSRTLPFPPRVAISQIWTTHRRKCSLSNSGSKRQRSSTMGIEVKIRFPGSRTLPLPPRITISHIWTTHGRKMFPIEFGVKRSKIKRHGHRSSNMASEL
jgi:hypothetical protein